MSMIFFLTCVFIQIMRVIKTSHQVSSLYNEATIFLISKCTFLWSKVTEEAQGLKGFSSNYLLLLYFENSIIMYLPSRWSPLISMVWKRILWKSLETWNWFFCSWTALFCLNFSLFQSPFHSPANHTDWQCVHIHSWIVNYICVLV